jgi:hypothetical protein
MNVAAPNMPMLPRINALPEVGTGIANTDPSLPRGDGTFTETPGSAATASEAGVARTQTVNPSARSGELTGGLTEQERQQVRELAARDREVRAHEQAHANVGGQYAGAPSYSYQRGPDGRQYAVGGEVSIDVSPIPGDPQATIDKARIVRRAALAPAEPSSQDRAVAAEATALEQQARAELLAQSTEGEDLPEADTSQDATLFYVPIDVSV